MSRTTFSNRMNSHDYQSLVSVVTDILKKVRGYTGEHIDQIFEEEKKNSRPYLVNVAIHRLTLEICNDRKYCAQLGVNYVYLPRDDIKRINIAATYLAKIDDKIVLPVIPDSPQ